MTAELDQFEKLDVWTVRPADRVDGSSPVVRRRTPR
jgi:hypothetical protein